jgi:hypothetical protein
VSKDDVDVRHSPPTKKYLEDTSSFATSTEKAMMYAHLVAYCRRYDCFTTDSRVKKVTWLFVS